MRGEPAQNLVREKEVRKQRAERVQQRQVRPQVVEVRAPDTYLAPELAARFLRCLFRADGACDKRAEVPFLENLRGNEEVVHDALLYGQFRVEVTPDGVECAVTADKPVEDSLELLDFGFQIPVRTFALAEHAPALVRKNQVAADAPDFAVLEGGDKLAYHIREEHRVRVAEHENFAFRNLLQAVEHRRLARVLRGLHEGNSLVGVSRDNFCGAVRRTVVAYQDFEFLFRVVDFQDVLDFALDDAFLVEGRYQERNRRQFKIFNDVAAAALEQFAHERERHRENHVAERKQKKQPPEGDAQIEYYFFTHCFIHSSSFTRNLKRRDCISSGLMESVTVNIESPLGASKTKEGKTLNSHTWVMQSLTFLRSPSHEIVSCESALSFTA